MAIAQWEQFFYDMYRGGVDQGPHYGMVRELSGFQ